MKFSIITPCYKCAKYVRETLDSVRTQKVADWELICVDDGSPDETGRVLDDYLREHCASVTESERVIEAIGDEDRHPDVPKRVLAGELPSGARMTVVHQQNCGVSGARNTALTLATGEWLVFLDGDDLLAPGALEIVSACLVKELNADIVECGFVNFNDGEQVRWERRDGKCIAVDLAKEIPDAPFSGCFQRFVFRREVVKEIAYKGVSCSEEMGYMVKGFIRAQKMIQTDSVFYWYRVVGGSMSHRGVSFRLFVDYYDAVRHVTKLLSQCGKTISSAASRGLVNKWTERQVSDIVTLENRNERRQAFSYWIQELPKLMRYDSMMTKWQRFIVGACCFTKSWTVACLLCFVPHWLKVRGFHR